MLQLLPPSPALATLERLRQAGFEAYFCGGCVRDALMGRRPNDWDIATSARPEQVEALFEKTVAVGREFGVMLVIAPDGSRYEVATFRTETGYTDGRRPREVDFASAAEDVRRRDFTINALLYDPRTDRVIDHVGGVSDIGRGILRTVGEPRERFLEDHLRLLRAVRFAAGTGFDIEPETHAALCAMAGLVRTVSAERVGDELQRMLTGGHARRALALLEETHLLLQVLPEVAVMRGVPQPVKFHPEGDVMEHTLLMLGLLDGCVSGDPARALAGGPAPELALTKTDRERGMVDARLSRAEHEAAVAFTWEHVPGELMPALAFAVLLHDTGKPATISYSDRIRFHDHDRLGAQIAEEVLLRLKRPRRLVETARGLVARHIHFSNLARMRRAKLRRWLQEPDFCLHLELHRLDCESSHRKLANYAFGVRAWQEELARPPASEPLLTGRDLLALGMAPGPRLGRVLEALRDAQLEERITTVQQARALALELWRERGAAGGED